MQLMPEYPGLAEPATAIENRVLGAIVLEPSLVLEHDIPPELFAHEAKQRIVRWVTERARAGRSADWVTLLDEQTRENGNPEAYGGAAFLMGLGDQACTDAAIPGYLRELQRLARGRALTLHLITAAHELNRADVDPLTVAELVISEASVIAAGTDDVEPIEPLVDRVLSTETQRAEGNRPRFLPTGMREWDRSPDFGGVSNEGVTLILGASGMGKTSMLNRLVLGLAETLPVYLHGTETSPERRVNDILLSLSGVDAKDWAIHAGGAGTDTERQYSRIVDAHKQLRGLPIQVSGSGSGMTVDRVCANARHLHKQGKCGVVVVDYLQDIAHIAREGLRRGDRITQVGYASGSLKDLSAELGIPVIVGAQVSGEKDGEKRDPRPKMWSVQWSSTAHQDAEEVYGLYRDDYYAERYPDWKRLGREGCLEIAALKRRTGRLGTLEVPFHGPSKWVGRR